MMLISFVEFINTYIFGPGLCVAVFACGMFLIIRLRPFFITKPRRMRDALKSGGENSGLSPVKAMLVALAGTLGVGNIAGVASAIAIGGAGAGFWMLASSVAALPIKYAEIVLALRHRRQGRDNKPHGGAYFYISDLGTKTASVCAGLFAALCLGASLTMGCAVQANAMAVSLDRAFGIPPILCGAVLAFLTLFTASGGLERISFLTSKLIPLMSGVYILMCLYIIFGNLPEAGQVVHNIFSEAFSVQAFGGGIIGFITNRALRIGVTRGVVSNEAGCGTAPIAHAGSATDSPAAQGVFGMFEVFIDTTVICTLTALCVLIAGEHGVTPVTDGMASAISAFSRFIPWADILLCISVIVFAFCTVICWFYYGKESLEYLCRKKNGALFGKIYLLIYSLTAAVGAFVCSDAVWGLSDLAISAMTALNICALLFSIDEVKQETMRYFYTKNKK